MSKIERRRARRLSCRCAARRTDRRKPRHRRHSGEQRHLSWFSASLLGEASSSSEFDTSALELIVEKIHGFGGEIALLHRTRVTAVFGLEPVEDAPRRTALAALAIQKAAERARRDGTGPWSVKLAIHVHDCALKATGARMAVEDESQQAAQAALELLLDAAPPDSAFVSETAGPFLERRFDLVPVPPGERASVAAYRLSGPERAGFGLGGRITAFVGRQQELALLESRLASVPGGRGHVVALIGEARMGKSRLLWELRQGLSAGTVTYLEGRCYSYVSAVPFFLMLDIVRQICGIAEGDTPAALEPKILAVLASLGVPAGEASPYLPPLFGAHREAELRAVNPALMKARTFDAIRQLILGACRRQPCVLVVEDLHSIDRTSDEFLALLVDSVPAAALLLVATYRPGYQPSWLARPYVTQVALAPLSGEDSLTVLGSALASAPVTPAVAAVIVARAEGNPFFIEELARAVSEHAEPDAPSLPDTIQSVLMARIDRLDEEERRLLQAAAVIGRDVSFAVIQAIADDGESVLHRRLRQLQAADFIHEARPTPHLAYAFKHALTHEVAYASVPPEQRRTLHARVSQDASTGSRSGWPGERRCAGGCSPWRAASRTDWRSCARE